MTLLPAEQLRITVPPQDWPFEGLPEICQVRGCGERGEQGSHHVIRRSHTGGPVRFVSIDGQVIVNEVKLCSAHHLAVTDHHAWIVWEHGLWIWYVEEKDPEVGGVFLVNHKSGRVFRRVAPLMEVRWSPSTSTVELY